MSDFMARIDQSACDKLLGSTDYPLVVSEKKEPFPGCSNLSVAESGTYYRYSDEQVDKMFADCVQAINSSSDRSEQSLDDQIYSFGGSIIQQAKTILEATSNAEYEGPSKSELTKIIDGGIENLGSNLRGFLGDWGLYAWCPLIRVTLKSRPAIKLKSPRVELKNFDIEVKATGELYAKYPWWNCYKYCFKWKKVIKCDRIAHISVSPDIAIDAHADFGASGAVVYGTGEFDKLRLDYPILREIPLEKLVNPSLKGKKIKVYDASKLLATIPVFESQFKVKAIGLPAEANGITIAVDVEEA